MRRTLGNLVVLAGTAVAMGPLAPQALAQDGTKVLLRADDDDEADDKETVKELEKFANELLVVDEDKKVHIKKEFKDALEESPLPPEQMERQAQVFFKVGDDGKLHVRDVDAIRPFLPQLKAYLPQLKGLLKKSPEERKGELEKMYKDRLPGGAEPPKTEPKPRTEPRQETPKANPEKRPTAEPRLEKTGDATEKRLHALEERLSKLEAAIDRIERAVSGRPGRTEERAAPPPPPAAPRWREEPWGWRAEPAPRRNDDRRSDDRRDRPGTRDRRDDRGENGLQGDDLRRLGERIQEELKRRLGDDLNPEEMKRMMERFQRELRDRFGGDRRRGDDERDNREERRPRRDRRDRDDDDDDR